MLCPTHNKELKAGKSGSLFCPTPMVKNPDGSVRAWCPYKPGGIPASTDNYDSTTEFRESLETKPTESAFEKDVRISKLSLMSTLAPIVRGHVDAISLPLDQLTDLIIEQVDKAINYIYPPQK